MASIGRPSNSTPQRSMALRNATGSANSGVMSLKRMPGLGKSGMSRMKAFRSSMGASAAGGRITRYEFSCCEATMPLTVRAATPADVPVIAEYNRRLARETEHTELDPATVTAGVAAAVADAARRGPYFLACDGED